MNVAIQKNNEIEKRTKQMKKKEIKFHAIFRGTLMIIIFPYNFNKIKTISKTSGIALWF